MPYKSFLHKPISKPQTIITFEEKNEFVKFRSSHKKRSEIRWYFIAFLIGLVAALISTCVCNLFTYSKPLEKQTFPFVIEYKEIK